MDSNIILEWLKIGVSGFAMSFVTWFLTRGHYKKQMRDQLQIGPLWLEVYKPLLTEYNNYIKETMYQNDIILNIKNIQSIITHNKSLIQASPLAIQKKINLIYSYCSSPKNMDNFKEHTLKIIDELGKLQQLVNSKYKDLTYDK